MTGNPRGGLGRHGWIEGRGVEWSGVVRSSLLSFPFFFFSFGLWGSQEWQRELLGDSKKISQKIYFFPFIPFLLIKKG